MQASAALSLCVIIGLPSSGRAQTRWETIRHVGGQRIEVDTADVGITRTGHITVWWRLSYRSPHSTPSRESPTGTLHWSSLTEHEEIDCHVDESRLIRQTLYNADGDAVSLIEGDSLTSLRLQLPTRSLTS